jgi:CRISPR-associated protein Csm5
MRLTPLSPIHIGTGDDLDWTSSVLDQKREQIVAFDSRNLDLNESDRRKLAALGEKALRDQLNPADFVREAQQFFKGHVEAALRARSATFAVMPNVLARLDRLTGVGSESRRADRTAVQAMNIARAAVDPRTGRPMIPGSGVKGALRTSWVDQNLRTEWVDPKKGEPKGEFQDDPFSQVAVEDFIAAGPMRSAIVHARNVSREQNTRDKQQKNLDLRVEAIVPGKATSFRGALRGLKRKDTANLFSTVELLDHAQAFHLGHWREQSRQLSQRADAWWTEALSQLVGNLKGEAILIRLGKLCTAESKTVKDRKIRVRISGSREDDRSHGTTFWLAGDENEPRGIPFGWALLEAEDDHGRAQELLAAFETHKPWRDLDLASSPPTATSGPVTAAPAVALTPGGKIIQDLQTKFDAKELSEDYLKSAVKQAVGLESSDDRQAVRSWIETHYKEVVRAAYRLRNFESFLAKLK